MDEMELKILKLHADAIEPAYQTDGSVGLDLHAYIDRRIHPRRMLIGPGQIALVKTGIAVQIPAGYEGQIRPRSGLALKYGVTVIDSPGTIDPDYRGDIGVVLINHSSMSFQFLHGDRIGQLVISPIQRVLIRSVDKLDKTDRDAGGFGHTGV